MIFIEVDNKSSCVHQLYIYKTGDCPANYAIHMEDKQSGFYKCLRFQDDTERSQAFQYMTDLLKDYVVNSREFISIQCKGIANHTED
jgi:hypothetical protein